jgi:thioredoxin-like negative regulator of GroEL
MNLHERGFLIFLKYVLAAVFAFHKGKVVDKFVGALGEAQVQQFVDKLKARAGGSS